MPAKFHTVSPGVWDKRLRRASRDAQVVAFNVWTSRQRVTEGLFELSPMHVAADTGMSVDDVERAFAELEAAGIIAYDAEVEVVLDLAALRTNPLRNGRSRKTGEPVRDLRIKPAVELYRRLPDTPLKARFLALADEHSPDLSAAIREDLGEAPSQVLPPEQEGPSKDLGRTSEGPSRGEASREEARRAEPEAPAIGRCSRCGDLAGWCGCDESAPADPRYATPAELARARGGL